MTEQEARRMLDEHRATFPRFVRHGFRYTVRPDGKVNVDKAIGKSGRRWVWSGTSDPATDYVPADVMRAISR